MYLDIEISQVVTMGKGFYAWYSVAVTLALVMEQRPYRDGSWGSSRFGSQAFCLFENSFGKIRSHLDRRTRPLGWANNVSSTEVSAGRWLYVLQPHENS